ncbi:MULTISPECIES: pentapeptide repeat-containing protein [Amycolatopsis]|uniref:Pentapeptide repeat-containing protein n=1 Tax=Amycolatopsis bullii TaxID=941987 RepID=A0ABQ3KA47_9PSEU|nr:pentapeptide repeat-containing protein [Amycolatopsis bullii]GHG08923.1 hypothetical protein GCM10017567_27220 [Amycolatopsis bullii]
MTVIARRPPRTEAHLPILIDTALPRVSIRTHEFDHPPRLASIYFTGADMRRADLRGADLTRAVMNYADLRGAMLGDACLHRAHLHRADLRYVELAGVDLTGADLTGAHLGDTHGLDAGQLASALIDNTTMLPPSLHEHPWVRARIMDCTTHTAVADGFCPTRTPEPISR